MSPIAPLRSQTSAEKCHQHKTADPKAADTIQTETQPHCCIKGEMSLLAGSQLLPGQRGQPG